MTQNLPLKGIRIIAVEQYGAGPCFSRSGRKTIGEIRPRLSLLLRAAIEERGGRFEGRILIASFEIVVGFGKNSCI